MRVLRCAKAIDEEITTQPDRFVAHLLAGYMSFMGKYEGDETLTVVLLEPGDTRAVIDSELHGQLLANPYSDKGIGDPSFAPPFETLTEHQSFYEMFFIEGGGEGGISVVIPKKEGIDPMLLDLCAQHSIRGHLESSSPSPHRPPSGGFFMPAVRHCHPKGGESGEAGVLEDERTMNASSSMP